MIERMGSTYQSLQGIEASRHLQASAAESKVIKRVLWDELPEADVIDPSEEQNPETRQPVSSDLPGSRLKQDPLAQLAPLIQEVREIAQAAGYVGVNSEDIIRAYRNGGSLLADHRV